MDGLISVLIIIGISIFTSSRKKKKAKPQKNRQASASSEAQVPREPAQAKIPFTSDEWQAFLKDMKVEAAPVQKQPAAVEPAVSAAHLQHDDPEGSISTQGESAAEHAKHRRKILEEETQRVEEHETLQEMRRMNLEKLRSAVVMSEVLGKPVSLRPRCHR